jgi:hypothetical protein
MTYLKVENYVFSSGYILGMPGEVARPQFALTVRWCTFPSFRAPPQHCTMPSLPWTSRNGGSSRMRKERPSSEDPAHHNFVQRSEEQHTALHCTAPHYRRLRTISVRVRGVPIH